jgi:hypothetical protein
MSKTGKGESEDGDVLRDERSTATQRKVLIFLVRNHHQ